MSDIGKICQEIITDITGKTTRSLEEADPMADIEQKSLNGSAFKNRVKALGGNHERKTRKNHSEEFVFNPILPPGNE
jgi:hypothetical protein